MPGYGYCHWPALFGVLAACVALMTVQVRFYESAKLWERTLDTLRHLLKTRTALAQLPVGAALSLAPGSAQVAKLTRAIERSLLYYVPFVDTLLVEYGDWLLLKNVKRYFRTRQLVAQRLPFLRDSFIQVAQLEADLALARQLRAAPVYCWAGTGAPRALALQGMRHPLLEHAAPLSFGVQGKGGGGGLHLRPERYRQEHLAALHRLERCLRAGLWLLLCRQR